MGLPLRESRGTSFRMDKAHFLFFHDISRYLRRPRSVLKKPITVGTFCLRECNFDSFLFHNASARFISSRSGSTHFLLRPDPLFRMALTNRKT